MERARIYGVGRHIVDRSINVFKTLSTLCNADFSYDCKILCFILVKKIVNG